MITSSGLKNVFEKPQDLLAFTQDQLHDYRQENEKRTLIFSFPEKLEKAVGEKKLVYKTGFLKEFLLILYPEVHYDKIYQMINDNYQMFASRRTMERNYKRYLELKRTFY